MIDESKRKQLGTHYTSREDIELIVEPVLMSPLRDQSGIVTREEAEPYLDWSNEDAGQCQQKFDRLKFILSGFPDRALLG